MTAFNPEIEADCIRRIMAGEKHLFPQFIRSWRKQRRQADR